MTQEEAFNRLLNMNLTDSFLLQKAIASKDVGEELSRVILETILGRKLGNISVTPEMIFPGALEKLHGTRFDVYIKENADATFDTVGEVFDLEAENREAKRSTLPKRVRFYRAKADSTHLPSGEEYDRLPDMYVIIVATFDPFGLNRMVYTIKNHCVEEPGMPYEDGATSIFLYCDGTEGEPKESLRKLLQYMKDTREENAVTPELKNIHQRVERIRHSEEVSKAYMKYYEELWDAKQEGIEEGIEQGIEQGVDDSIRKLAQHLMSKNASQTEEDAMREAELILR